jgi:hypothetical protein
MLFIDLTKFFLSQFYDIVNLANVFEILAKSVDFTLEIDFFLIPIFLTTKKFIRKKDIAPNPWRCVLLMFIFPCTSGECVF